MPARVNTSADIGTALVKSDAYDKDNIFLTDEGWVYRHYKNAALTKFWDEIIVAGEVVSGATINGVPNNPVDAINDISPTFETGDGDKDVEYSPDFSGGGAAAPSTGPAASVTLVGDTSTQADGSVTATATTSSNGSGLTVTYTATSGTASALAIAAAGSGYQAGDSFTVVGDTGVTGTVSI
jgi:hypothetical protein